MTTAGAAMASLRWGSQAVARTPSGFVQEAWADGPRGLGWSMPPTRARVSPHTPGHAIHAGSSSVTISSARARRVALAVGEVVPRLGLVEAGLEVGGVRAAGDVDHRPVGVAGDLDHLRPRALLGLAVLGVDGEVGRAVVHAQLDHLPVALVQADPERQVVVVVEVEEPVLQPQVPVGLDGVAVHAVAQLGARGAQRDVLLAVVLAWGRRCGRRRAPPCRRRSASAPEVVRGSASSRWPAGRRGRARRRRGAARCPGCRSIPRRCRRSTAPSSRTSGRADGGAGDRRAHPCPYRTQRRQATASPLLWLIVRV